MAQPTNSFTKFNYSLRPSKQVERKIMIEVLLRLSAAGYKISEYKYVGFGSPFYVDFIMFHKYLFMHDMTCVEWGDIRQRMKFNKPYGFIRLRFGAFLKHIPAIKITHKHLVWLDYDRSLDQEMLQDIDGALSRLGAQSIFIITTDARPRLPRDVAHVGQMMSAHELENQTVEMYEEWFRPYTELPITLTLAAQEHAADLFRDVIVERIRRTLVARGVDLKFVQLFNFLYRDDAPMMTIGGMVGAAQDVTALENADIFKLVAVRNGAKYLEISVPPLTAREKHWLDSNLIGCIKERKPKFELDEDLLKNYLAFYKEYPTYLETLL